MKHYLLPALLLILFIIPEFLHAQSRVTYRDLVGRSVAPAFYLDHSAIPVNTDGDNVWLHFRFAYDALHFLAISNENRPENAPADARFFSDIELSIEIIKGELRRGREVPDDAQVHRRLVWNGKAFAQSYDQTQDASVFLNGNLSVKLEPGDYIHRVRITSDNKTVRIGNPARRFSVPDFNQQKNLPIHFTESGKDGSYPLLNFGQAVPYARNFSILAWLPSDALNGPSSYSVVIEELSISSRDTIVTATVFDQSLTRNDVFGADKVSVKTDGAGVPSLKIDLGNTPRMAYASLEIPNRAFRNSSFRIVVKKDGEAFSERYFRSLWIDIPRSLLNLDVAIGMMQHIVDRDTFRNLRRGNETERERKFIEFWKERDPEPETDFNPLMVEFFRRVDLAYDRFTTPGNPGYDSDRGKMLLRRGEPDEITRSFPPGRPAVEVWRYGNQEFVFESTSGFGDYVLVSPSR